MKNNFSKLIILGLILVIGGSIFTALAYAESGLSLIVNKECDIEYSGNSCKADLEMKNSTGEVLEGEVLLSIDYEGTCGTGSGPFDGEGITAQFLINEKTFNFSSEWDNGTTTVSGFDIKKDKTSPKLEINTVPNLCPGEYTYTLTIKGTSEGGEEYVTEPTPVGGGGGSSYNPPEEEKIINIEDVSILEVISQETGEREEVLGWNTTDESNEPLATNGAVVYGTQSVFDNNLGPAPNYGYQFRQESEGKKENHTITLGNLQPGATYYYRIISWASPDTVSREYTFTVSEESEELVFTEETIAGEDVSGTGGGEPIEGTGGTGETGTGEPEEEEIEDLITQLTEEGELPSFPAGLLTAATLLTLGTGKNIIAMLILFVILVILFFLYDKYFRRAKKNKVKGF